MREWLVKGNEYNGHPLCQIDGPVPEIGEFITVIDKREYDRVKQKYLWLRMMLKEVIAVCLRSTDPNGFELGTKLQELLDRAESS